MIRFSCRSPLAQRQSTRLLTEVSVVRIHHGEPEFIHKTNEMRSAWLRISFVFVRRVLRKCIPLAHRSPPHRPEFLVSGAVASFRGLATTRQRRKPTHACGVDSKSVSGRALRAPAASARRCSETAEETICGRQFRIASNVQDVNALRTAGRFAARGVIVRCGTSA